MQACLERLAASLGLLHALLAQVRVEPAAEPVLLVPGGLAVAEHHHLQHVGCESMLSMVDYELDFGE